MNNPPSFLSETTSEIERKPALGQVAVVMMALVIGLLFMGIQLWLLTVALDLYLAGHGTLLWLIVLISGLIFLGGLLMLRVLHRHPDTPSRLPSSH